MTQRVSLSGFTHYFTPQKTTLSLIPVRFWEGVFPALLATAGTNYDTWLTGRCVI